MSITAATVTTPASAGAVTLQEAKDYLRITHDAEDRAIQRMVDAAERYCETYTRRFLITRTVQIAMDRFPTSALRIYNDGWTEDGWYKTLGRGERALTAPGRDSAIYLPGGKVQSVASIDYVDSAGASQQLTGPTSDSVGTEYQEDLTDDEWGVIMPPRNSSWPTVQTGNAASVVVTFDAGYGSDPDDVPEDVRQAVLFKAQEYFERGNGVDKLSEATRDLLHPYRIVVI